MDRRPLRTLKPFENSVDLTIMQNFFNYKGDKSAEKIRGRVNRTISFGDNVYTIDNDAYVLLQNKYS